MTPTIDTSPSPDDSLSLELDLQHPPEKVWRALTTPELLAEWLLPVIGLKLEPGAEFLFKTQPYPGWDGVVNCTVLDVEPHKRLSYAWKVPSLDTVVTFTLTPTATGTRLTIAQSGFKASQRREFGGARYGWNMMGGKLIELLGRQA